MNKKWDSKGIFFQNLTWYQSPRDCFCSTILWDLRSLSLLVFPFFICHPNLGQEMSSIQELTSDTANSCHTLEVPIAGTQNGALGGELQSLQAAYRLNRKNCLKWSQLIRTFLKGKGKLSHLLGTGPKEGDPAFAAWDEEDSLIMSWIWNSMVPEISDTVMFLTIVKDIWEAINLTYSKGGSKSMKYGQGW